LPRYKQFGFVVYKSGGCCADTATLALFPEEISILETLPVQGWHLEYGGKFTCPESGII